MRKELKKNLLDLNYNKYIQYKNTFVILFFTNVIGWIVAFATNQINFNNYFQLGFVLLSFSAINFYIFFFLIRFNKKLFFIIKEIKNL